MSKGKWILVGILSIVALLMLGANIQTGGCVPFTSDENSNNYAEWDADWNEYIFAGGKVVDLQFEADTDGAGTTGELTLHTCTEQDPESCVLFEFDSDFDGIPDTSILDGVSDGQRGLRALGIAGFLRIEMTTASLTTEDPMLWVCASGT